MKNAGISSVFHSLRVYSTKVLIKTKLFLIYKYKYNNLTELSISLLTIPSISCKIGNDCDIRTIDSINMRHFLHSIYSVLHGFHYPLHLQTV